MKFGLRNNGRIQKPFILSVIQHCNIWVRFYWQLSNKCVTWGDDNKYLIYYIKQWRISEMRTYASGFQSCCFIQIIQHIFDRDGPHHNTIEQKSNQQYNRLEIKTVYPIISTILWPIIWPICIPNIHFRNQFQSHINPFKLIWIKLDGFSPDRPLLELWTSHTMKMSERNIMILNHLLKRILLCCISLARKRWVEIALFSSSWYL